MSDLISFMILSTSTMSSSAARSAKNAAEENMEGKTRFVTLLHHKLEYTDFYSAPKLSITASEIGLKKSDIAYLVSSSEYKGFTTVHLEFRCDCEKDVIYVKGTLKQVTDILNSI